MKNLTFVNVIVALSVTFLFSGLAPAQGKKAEIKQIDMYRKEINAFSAKYKNPNLIVAEVSDATTEGPAVWKKFKSKKSVEEVQFNQAVYIWKKNNKIVQANFTVTTPSGDWMQFVNHYFREDGTLAKVEERLNTFYGNVTVKRSYYFDRRGTLLQKTAKYYDLNTQQPKKSSEVNFTDEKAEIFKKLSKLPFVFLLGKM
jgi:hypothetical protein